MRRFFSALRPKVVETAKKVLGFDAFRESVREYVADPRKYYGRQSLTLPRLNAIAKGLRPGELTIFTGHTGTGKTTVLSHLSLDYCAQGLPTLWGSFEIAPRALLLKMLAQFAQGPITLDNFDRVSDGFARLPMYLLDYFGSTPLEDVLPAMEQAVREHGVGHIVLDNLQFMLSGQGDGFDKFALLDHSIAALRAFSTRHGVHVTVVVHPRKEMDDADLGVHSIYGSPKATQEADNVFILQRDHKTPEARYLDVKKNRFDGQLGRVHLGFDRPSGQVYELPPLETPNKHT